MSADNPGSRDCGFCAGTGMDHGYGERPCYWCSGDARVVPICPHGSMFCPACDDADDPFRMAQISQESQTDMDS